VGAGRFEFGHRIKPANLLPDLYRCGGASTTDRTDIRSARQPFDQLFLIEPGKQLLGSQPRQRMAPVGCNLGEWQEHESALVEPRVWHDKRGCLGHLTPIIEEIEIEHAGCVSLPADTTKLSLYRVQHREQVSRGEMGCQRCDRVNKPRLVRARYRLSSIPSRAGRDLNTLCFERDQGGCERIEGRAEPRAGQIAADADQDQFVAHALRLLDPGCAL